MEAASPTHTVETSGLTCLIVSNTAMPALWSHLRAHKQPHKLVLKGPASALRFLEKYASYKTAAPCFDIQELGSPSVCYQFNQCRMPVGNASVHGHAGARIYHTDAAKTLLAQPKERGLRGLQTEAYRP